MTAPTGLGLVHDAGRSVAALLLVPDIPRPEPAAELQWLAQHRGHSTDSGRCHRWRKTAADLHLGYATEGSERLLIYTRVHL